MMHQLKIRRTALIGELERVLDQLLNYHIKIMLGNSNAIVGRKDISKSTILKESVCKISNGNEVRVGNFATSLSKSTVFSHYSIQKYTWVSPDWRAHNHFIDDVTYWHSNIVDVQSLRGVDCVTIIWCLQK
jgi:hypothetical protein